MAAETTNYGLTKPAANESYDITVFNRNADVIDAALAAHEADGVKHLTAAERTAWNAKAAGDHTHTAAQVGAVPTTRKVNGKALSADITLTAGDVGAFGMLGSSTTADLDTCKTPGCLLVHNSCANWPAGETADWGLLRIEANGSGGVVQTLTVRLTSTTKPTKAYYRMYSGDVWSVWGQIATDSDLEGYLPLTGGTLTGNLDIAKTIASVVLRTGDSSNRLSGRLMKNANVEGTVDDGLYLTDYGADGSEATLKIHGGQQRLRIKLGGTDYAVYHEGSKPAPADIGAAAVSHSHGAGDITSGTLPVARGGTGAASLTSGAALIGAGTGAVTTRAIKDNTSASAALTASSALVTMNTLRYALNRTTGPGAADTNYTTFMVRAEALYSSDTTPSKNGQISWTYE